MKRRLHSIMILLAVSCSLRAAEHAPDVTRITLHDSAVVSQDRIYLHDVAVIDGTEETGRVRIGNSPWPGHARRVSLTLVRMRLMAAGHDPDRFLFDGPDACIVRRATERIDPDEIIAAAHDYLRQQFPDGTSIHLVNDCPPVVIEESGHAHVQLLPSIQDNGGARNAVTVNVDIIVNERRVRRVPLRFEVIVHDQVAVANRRIAVGARIEAEHLVLQKRNIGSMTGQPMACVSAVAGQVARRTIGAGQIVTRDMIETPAPGIAVRSNDRVTLVFDNGILRIDTAAVALHQARIGERVRVRNISSGREVEGMAVEAGVVRIQ